ncbi:MAG TPA: ADOP family duplicated permease [Gemmatimonadaceae bacterium]|nr:ADOP family duplicated permease [Gemmatimonadaceae bacterium]
MRLRLKQQRLIELLGASSLSQNHWALKVGLSRGHWSEIVNGKHPYPSAKTRVLILDALQVPLEELFDVEVGIDPLADVDFRRAVADRYIIDTEIGQGGMGAVYLARDVRHGRAVAVKVISPEAVSGIGLTQFHREISAIAQLHHQNILQLLDSGDAAGHPFYVMPLVRGGSLRARLQRDVRLDLASALRLTRGVADALHHAHGERLLHCDVKPENVLLNGDHAWVMDFGIARKLHSEVGEWTLRKELDISAGTPAYVSPEQAAGDPNLDARSDVYSLGCMVYEMLAGRTPFGGTSTQEIVANRFIVPPPPLRDFAPEIPGAVAAVLERAMALPREQRPESAAAFVAELEHAASRQAHMFGTASLTATRTLSRMRRRLKRSPAHTAGGIVRDFVNDISLTLRGLRRSPGFGVIVILTLALALGANATMFGIVDRLLLRPPSHIVEPDLVHRVRVARWFDGFLPPSPALSVPAFFDIRDRGRAFSHVAASVEDEVAFGVGLEGRSISALWASGQYFELLGVKPALGRFYSEAEDRLPIGQAVAVLGFSFWQSVLGSDPRVVGRTLSLNGRPFEVIGVAPKGFTGTRLERVDVFIPLAQFWASGAVNFASERGYQFLDVFVRRRHDMAESAANLDVARAYREGHADSRPYEAKAVASLGSLIPGREPSSGGQNGRVAAWLFGMALIVLLIACANVASLVLARGLSRRAEVAVRRALGGNMSRLVRQFFTESFVVALLGCAVGLALAYVASDFVRATLLPGTSWDAHALDTRVLLVTAVATLFATVAAGVLPLLRGTSSDVAAELHGAGRGSTGQPRRWLASLLLLQVSLTTVLLVGAGLFLRSLDRVQQIDLGLEPQQLLKVDASFNRVATPRHEIAAFYRAAAERVRTIPGVEAAGTALGAPFMSNYGISVRAPGVDTLPRLAGGGPYWVRVGAGGMEALGLRLLRGRHIAPNDDRAGAPLVVVLTQRMANALWPNRDPLEQCIEVSRRPCAPVIGIVSDVHRQKIREEPFLLFFTPIDASDSVVVPEALLVRVSASPESMIGAIRRELLALRPSLPYVRIEPYEDLITPQARSWRLGAVMFTAFGVLSLVIAAVGVYGVLSFSVRRRTRELGIRSALGASRGVMLRSVMLGGVGLAVAGVAAGALVAFALAGRLQPLLFDTSAREPFAYALAAVCIVLFAFVASLVPGLRATRVDPLAALRAE